MSSHVSVFEVENAPIGLVLRSGNIVAFFGNRRATEGAVAEAFPRLAFRYLQQTHSAKVLHSTASSGAQERPEADAHWTRETGVALAIRTADCLPVLFASPEHGAIAAVHAGWRGLEGEILLKAGIALLQEGFPPPDFHAFVGPGIGPRSFEAGVDVADRLEATFRKARFDQTETSLLDHERPEKKRVDLFKIAFAQLRASGVPDANVSAFAADTFADPGYFSYRRDRENAGRQVSFVAML